MTRSTIRGARTLALATIVSVFALGASPAPVSAAGGDTVRSLYDNLLAAMRNGPAL
jgi:hypothetical protein